MTSSSGTGFTEITLQFDRSRTVNSAAEDVQAAINATQGQLPASLLSPPTYRKTNPADSPILLIALASETLPIMTVSDYAEFDHGAAALAGPRRRPRNCWGRARSVDPHPGQPGPARRREP